MTREGRTQVTASIDEKIADELGVAERQVHAAVELLDGGSTVPFVARYRKEVTDSLDDTQLRRLEERLRYLRELEDRRKTILDSIDEQGKLTDELRANVQAAETKARLEDIYLPYKPKRRTKGQIAREAGLEPLADELLGDPTTVPDTAAEEFVNDASGINDTSAALDGARAILVERFAEDADLIGDLRERMWARGGVSSKVRAGKETDGAKFADYFDFAEPFGKLPSHRVLALLRGEKEEVLDVNIEHTLDADAAASGPTEYETTIADHFGIANQGRSADNWLTDTVRWAWRTKIALHLGIDLRMRLRQAAEDDAVEVFAGNLRDLLLAAPAGGRATLGLDPGYRTGVKVAVTSATGKVVETATIYPHKPQGRWDDALATLRRLVTEHDVSLVAIGNGTASRETDQLASALIKRCDAPEQQTQQRGEQPQQRGEQTRPGLTKVTVSEAGASVYSASEFASKELPELDVSLRGAVSIARRLQDPLAELVKIDPKSIGVGQYQHDVTDSKLSRSLDAVVEDCVNGVGVDLNTASVPLLRRVSGIGAGLADNIVAHRDANGPFQGRGELHDVSRLGPKAFEQCAGFLRVTGGTDPLDASAVHPESYPVARRIVTTTGHDIRSALGNTAALNRLRPGDFVDDTVGLPTVTDILTELEKPGRDPRPEFTTASFAEGVEEINDLRPGMRLEGAVTNVAAFGAFVDIGVHQDGLVHISAMSHKFVNDPREVVKPGDVVTVKVLDVDVARNRIGLTLRMDDEPATSAGKQDPGKGKQESGNGKQQAKAQGGKSKDRGGRAAKPAGGAMADALRNAGYKGNN